MTHREKSRFFQDLPRRLKKGARNLKSHPYSRPAVNHALQIYGWARPILSRHPVWRVTFIACVLAIAYWGIIASDRYVSEAHVVILRTDDNGSQAKSTDISSLLTGAVNGSRIEQLLLRDHLLSVDMLKKLDQKLKLREHYSDIWHDPLSQMWFKNASMEWFHRHYLSRVSIEFDDTSGVLVVKAQAYDPEMAHAIAYALVEEGERAMNEMAHDLARGQLTFVENEVAMSADRFQKARNAVLAFQNEKRMVAPQATAETLAGTINKLEATRIELQTKRTAMLGYLSPKAPAVVEIDMQIRAVENQTAQEQSRLASPNGKTLNTTVEEYQRLEMAAVMTQDIYKTALVALEKTRVESTRSIRKVIALQKPTMPQYPMEPARLYNIIVFILSALLVAGIFQMFIAIIREHKD